MRPSADSPFIYFCDGYKYQLREDMWVKTNIMPPHDIVTDLVELHTDGWLLIRRFFAWDGCSGPTFDTPSNARGGLIHDALYFLMRMGLLDSKCQQASDEMLERTMVDDGAWPMRARLYRWAVSLLGSLFIKTARKIIKAPLTRRAKP